MKEKGLLLGILAFMILVLSISFSPGNVKVVEVVKPVVVKENPMSMDKFVNDLGMIESRNNYGAKRNKSQYWGKYQLGTLARVTVGIDTVQWETFKSDSLLQDAAVKVYLLKIRERLTDHMYPDSTTRNFIEEYAGTVVGNYNITESGLIGMAHNCGVTGTKIFLISNGRIVPVDGLGTPATKYLTLANYEIDMTLEQAEANLKLTLFINKLNSFLQKHNS